MSDIEKIESYVFEVETKRSFSENRVRPVIADRPEEAIEKVSKMVDVDKPVIVRVEQIKNVLVDVTEE